MIQLPNIKQEIDFLLSGAPRNSTIPILKSIAIEFKNGKVRMRTTDLETTCYAVFINRERTRKVNGVARLTKRLVQEENNVAMKKPQGNGIQIYWNDVPVVSDSLDEFPSFPFNNRQKRTELPIADLIPILDKAIMFCSKDELKPSQCGVYVGREHCSKTTIASTDGHRLFIHSSFIPDMPKVSIIIPRSSIMRLRKLNKLADDLTFELVDAKHTHLHIKNNTMGLVSRLIDERFPYVEAVIPDKFNHTCQGETKVWLETLRYINDVAPLGKGNERQIILKHQKCHTYDGNTGLSHDFTIPIRVPLEIGFNINYLLDIFKTIDAEQFTWKFTSPTSASIIIPRDSEEKYLIMPMRITEY